MPHRSASATLRAPNAKVFKPRREFRAWLLNELNVRGASLPLGASYFQIRSAVAAILPPVQK